MIPTLGKLGALRRTMSVKHVRNRSEEGSTQPSLDTLRTENELFKAALDHMDQGLLMIDADGNVPVHNRRVSEMLGLPEELLARRPSFREIVEHQVRSEEFRDTDDAFKQWAIERGIEISHHKYLRKRPDGTFIEVRSVPLTGGGAVRTFTDVTEAVKKEEDLRVAQAELIAAREKAEAASRAKSHFLAAMSHEIRTPLNAVLGLATCLLECNLGPEERKMVQTIHDFGDSLLQILNDVLDFSKLEAAQLTFEEIAFSPETSRPTSRASSACARWPKDCLSASKPTSRCRRA